MNDLPNLVEKFAYLNDCLKDKTFLLGKTFSIADLSCSMLIENSQICSDLINVNHYPNIVSWIATIKNEIGNAHWDNVMSEFIKMKK
mgnify:CR=1 FL=1